MNKEFVLPISEESDSFTFPLPFDFSTEEGLISFAKESKEENGPAEILVKLKQVGYKPDIHCLPFLLIEKVGSCYNKFESKELSSFFKNLEVYKVLNEEGTGYLLFDKTLQECIPANYYVPFCRLHYLLNIFHPFTKSTIEEIGKELMKSIQETKERMSNINDDY